MADRLLFPILRKPRANHGARYIRYSCYTLPLIFVVIFNARLLPATDALLAPQAAPLEAQPG